jgi:sucrose-6-phosphate hydrolase SacC (GH32 family)
MNNWEYAKDFPTSPWRGTMTLPRELTLVTQNGKHSLAANPVAELNNYLGEKLSAGNKAELLQIKATVSTSEGLSTKFRVTADAGSYFEFGYDAKTKTIFIDRSNAWNDISSTHIHSVRYAGDEKTYDICAIVDRTSVEIFAADGTHVLTDLLFLTGVGRSVSFEIAEGCQPPRSIEVRAITPRR